MAVLTMVEAIRQALADEMARDERVVVLGEDVGVNGGVFRATEGLRERFGAARVVDTPLAEAVIIGASVGLAMAGMVPVPEIQFLGFSQQAFHQIAGQLARLRYRTDGRHGCPHGVQGGAGIEQGPEQHVAAGAGTRVDPGRAHGCGAAEAAVVSEADALARATRAAWTPAPKPLSTLTTTTPGAQELSMASSAATPPSDMP